LETGREAGMKFTAAECDHARLQRCTQRLEDRWLEFRRLIKKKHTFVRTRNRARLRHSLPAADDAGHRC
jgi:hypothetical protein